jgi:peptidoglycan hydrolase CwlO-like protein
MPIKCSNCGHENPAGRPFCQLCGHRLASAPQPPDPQQNGSPVLNSELQRLQVELETAKKSEEHLRRSLSSTTGEMEALKRQVADAAKPAGEYEQKLHSAQQTEDQLRQSLAAHADEIETLRRQVAETDQPAAELQQKWKDAQEEIKRLTAKLAATPNAGGNTSKTSFATGKKILAGIAVVAVSLWGGFQLGGRFDPTNAHLQKEKELAAKWQGSEQQLQQLRPQLGEALAKLAQANAAITAKEQEMQNSGGKLSALQRQLASTQNSLTQKVGLEAQLRQQIQAESLRSSQFQQRAAQLQAQYLAAENARQQLLNNHPVLADRAVANYQGPAKGTVEFRIHVPNDKPYLIRLVDGRLAADPGVHVSASGDLPGIPCAIDLDGSGVYIQKTPNKNNWKLIWIRVQSKKQDLVAKINWTVF